MKKLNLHHSTNQVFENFDTRIGIGIHFGTKKAALDRMKDLDAPNFEIEHVKPSKKDLNCKKFMEALNFKRNNPTEFRLQRARRQGFDTAKIYCHGTAKINDESETDIHGFQTDKIGDRWRADREGFFFSNFAPHFNYYSSSDFDYEEKGKSNGAVYPVYLKMEKPLIIDENFLKKNNMGVVLGVTEDAITFWDEYQDFILESYHRGSYDSIIIRDETDPKIGPVEMPIVFKPSQIRSFSSIFHPELANMRFLHESSHPDFERVQIIDLALAEIAPKTSMDPLELRNKMKRMSPGALRDSIKEYASLPKSPSFLRSLSVAEKGESYIIKINGQKYDSTSSKNEAKSIVKDLKKNMVKEVNLSIENPLRMSDLGKWSPELVARELNLDLNQNDLMHQLESETDKFDYLKSIIFERGYDSIVYENKVEGKGTDSYVALKDEQVEIVNDFQSELEIA